jgi:hypothetical protein
MDPYRTSFDLCPACGFGLRDFEGRRVCDGCSGLMMAKDDFAQSSPDIHELDVDKKDVEQEVGSCAQHGLWFPGGALSVVLAELSRRNGASTGGAFYVPRWANAGAFRGGQYLTRAGKARPTVHTPLPLAHAGKPLACPECKSELVQSGMTWMCSRHGALIEEHALDAMIGEMTGAPWEPPAWTGKPGARPCPACATAMAVEKLDGIEVDRCAKDGIWMDPGELEGVLAKAGDRGRKGWVSRLFRRKT